MCTFLWCEKRLILYVTVILRFSVEKCVGSFDPRDTNKIYISQQFQVHYRYIQRCKKDLSNINWYET